MVSRLFNVGSCLLGAGLTAVFSLSLAQAQRVAIETNETKFEVDRFKLSEIMTDLDKEFTREELSETMPYNENEMDSLLSISDFDWGSLDGETNSNEDEKPSDGLVKIDINREDYDVIIDRFDMDNSAMCGDLLNAEVSVKNIGYNICVVSQ